MSGEPSESTSPTDIGTLQNCPEIRGNKEKYRKNKGGKKRKKKVKNEDGRNEKDVDDDYVMKMKKMVTLGSSWPVRLTEKAMCRRLEVGASAHIEAKSVRHTGDPHDNLWSLAVGYCHFPHVTPHSIHPHPTDDHRSVYFSPSHSSHTQLHINLHLHTTLEPSRRCPHSNLTYSVSPRVGRQSGVVCID